jgi:hypothetical protein
MELIEKETYSVTKEDYIGFWRDGGGEKLFFDSPWSSLIIEMVEEVNKDDKEFVDWFHHIATPIMVYYTRDFLTREEMAEVLSDVMWQVVLVIANMYDHLFVDMPPMHWVFDTPDDPFEKYLVLKMPDAYEKYETIKNLDELFQ